MSNLVTVVIPVAESHQVYLPRALDSVANSTLATELVVVNDAESEFTIEGAQVLHTGGKRGSAYARNLGIQHAQTDFVFFLDADDVLLNTGIEVLLRGFAKYEDCCYTYGDSYRLSGNGKQLEYRTAEEYDRPTQIRHALHLVSVLIPTALAREVKFDETYRGWEDFKYFIELGVQGYCGRRVPYPIIIYDLGSSLNRIAHNARNEQEGIYQETQAQYDTYLKGVTSFMPCGCNQKRPNPTLPTTQLGNGVAFHFVAPMADRTIRMLDQTRYYAQRGQTIFVKPEHADEVERRFGKLFKREVQASLPTVIPTPEELNNANGAERVARYLKQPARESAQLIAA